MIVDASAIYTKAVLAMRAQAEPSAVSARQTITPHDLNVRIVRDRFGNTSAYLVSPGDGRPATFTILEDVKLGTERTTDETTQTTYPDQRLFWTLDWPTIHEIGLRPPAPTAPRATPPVAPANTVVFDDRYYHVTYAGVDTRDGAAVYHLRLSARGSRDAHPLTDLYIDQQTFLVREVAATFRNEEVIAGDTGTLVLDFGRVGSYWLVTHGTIEAREHSLLRHSSGFATFVNDDFSF